MTAAPDRATVDGLMRLVANVEAAGARRGRDNRAPSDYEPEIAEVESYARRLTSPAGESAIPRELMESYLGEAQEATMTGFRESVIACMLTPAIERLMEKCYRMGFESGWRIREGLAAPAAPSAGQAVDADKLIADIKSLPVDAANFTHEETVGYRCGHRDARHDAAELVLAAFAASTKEPL